ncbi:MAG TPA: phosphoribosylanthranilate isomerase [Spirochaetota bacterium]|nr:phosphoribosylanthranilate isomerase [Spirochaetota bacterium]
MKVKICGIARTEDAVVCALAGADYIGFVFASSPRQIDVKRAGEICTGLERLGLRHKIKIAGVFVNETGSVMRSHIRNGIIDIAQVHGDESAEQCAEFDFPFIRAMRVKDLSVTEESEKLEHDVSILTCRTVIIDSFSQKVYGGSGVQVGIDSAIRAGRILRNAGKEFFIAGGLTPDNAADIISAVSPDGIDISGGVEESPGIKSKEKIMKLMEAVSGGNI